MRKIPGNLVLLILCVLSTIGVAITLRHCVLTVPQRIAMWFILFGLIYFCLRIWYGPVYSNSARNAFDDLINSMARDPMRWVKKGLIPFIIPVEPWLMLHGDYEEAIETLNKRSINMNIAVWKLNDLIAKEFPWFKNKDWVMNLDSPVQIDYGAGKNRMVYYIDKKIKIPILIVKVSWKNTVPIFAFRGILAWKVSRIWRNFLKTVKSENDSNQP